MVSFQALSLSKQDLEGNRERLINFDGDWMIWGTTDPSETTAVGVGEKGWTVLFLEASDYKLCVRNTRSCVIQHSLKVKLCSRWVIFRAWISLCYVVTAALGITEAIEKKLHYERVSPRPAVARESASLDWGAATALHGLKLASYGFMGLQKEP